MIGLISVTFVLGGEILKFRHEIKHYINYSDYLAIRSRLKHIAKTDSHANQDGQYKIRSIYFDNYNDKVLAEKILGFNKRSKFRIRFYNDDASFIRLEKKSKINGLCNKTSTSITKEQCEAIISGKYEFLRESEKALFNELYLAIKEQLLRPKTIVDYIREAYIYDVGNVRVTFDIGVRTGISSTNLFEKDLPTVDVVRNNVIILEIKYDEFLPEIISHAIQLNDRRAAAISKYAMCRI